MIAHHTVHATRVYSVKLSYVAELKKFIIHKNVLANTSTWYKKHEVAKNLAIVNSVFLPVLKKPDSQTMAMLSALVLVHQNSLRAILPCHNNDSFLSSSTIIESIINTAKSYHNNKPVVC